MATSQDIERDTSLNDLTLWSTDHRAERGIFEERIGSVLFRLLARDGYRVAKEAREAGTQFDLLAESAIERVAIEIQQFQAGELYREDVYDRFAASVASAGGIHRGLIVANAPILDETMERVRRDFGVDIQVFDPTRLRQWVERSFRVVEDVGNAVMQVVRATSRALANLVASNLDALMHIEWRELEKIVAEVFDGLGFSVELTPSSKDGGRDVVVTGLAKGQMATYYIEIKHWRCGNKVGMDPLKSFVSVVASKKVAGGLFLSTSGFTVDVNESCAEIQRQSVTLGGSKRLQTLCRLYERRGGFLCPSPDLEELVTGT